MRGRIQKWGNSLGLRIPKSFAQQANLREGFPVDIRVEGEILTVKAFSHTYDLDDLTAMISPENRHGEEDYGGPAGGEVW